MTVNPDAGTVANSARFSSTALYVFHVNARTSLTDTNPDPESQVICRFDNGTPQNMECWLGQKQYVKAPLNQKTPSADNGAGRRDVGALRVQFSHRDTGSAQS